MWGDTALRCKAKESWNEGTYPAGDRIKVWQQKKALSDSSKLQSCARAVHRAGGSTREQPTGRDTAHSGKVHWTEQRILEVTTGRSPRGLVTSSPRVSAVSSIPVLPKPPPLAARGCTREALGTRVSLDVPQEGCRTRAGAGREQQQR